MTEKTFADLGLTQALIRATEKAGFTTPTPIQAGAIPAAAAGRDLLGIAQTGTGKTGAFALPLLQRLAESKTERLPKRPRSLILAPTRELAIQVAQTVQTFARPLNLRYAVVHGGVSQHPQVSQLTRGLDVLIACPGRLLDLMDQKAAYLDRVEILVLDEADRMLDLGFVRDIRKIAKLVPEDRQTLLFSATMPDDIADLAASLLSEPERVEVTPAATPVERIDQSVLLVAKPNKRKLLAHLLKERELTHTIVFSRTKHGVDRIVQHLEKSGIVAAGLHGDKSQGARRTALDGFKRGRIPVLVATDIAARGIDVTGISHVVNLDLPNVPETYVHRIGRTARAGRDGAAISFCEVEEVPYLKDIERVTQQSITVDEEHPFHEVEVADVIEHAGRSKPQSQKRGGRGRGGRNGGGGGGGQQAGQASSKGEGGKPNSGKSNSGKPANANRSRNRRRGNPQKKAA